MEINIQKRVLEKNLTDAEKNRTYFRDQKVFVLNMMSSPGSGKTALLDFGNNDQFKFFINFFFHQKNCL